MVLFSRRKQCDSKGRNFSLEFAFENRFVSSFFSTARLLWQPQFEQLEKERNIKHVFKSKEIWKSAETTMYNYDFTPQDLWFETSLIRSEPKMFIHEIPSHGDINLINRHKWWNELEWIGFVRRSHVVYAQLVIVSISRCPKNRRKWKWEDKN